MKVSSRFTDGICKQLTIKHETCSVNLAKLLLTSVLHSLVHFHCAFLHEHRPPQDKSHFFIGFHLGCGIELEGVEQ